MGDRTRLGIVGALAYGPQPVGRLAEHSGMALPSFLQHLKVLEAVDLVRTEKIGRVRMCHLRTEALIAAQLWIETQRSAVSSRLDNLERFVASEQDANGDYG